MPSESAGFARSARRLVAACLLGAVAAALVVCFGSTQASATGDDTAVTQAIVKDLEADKEHLSLVEGALARSKKASATATDFRAKGDEAHAKVADGLAREWAEFGKELVDVAVLEGRAGAAHFAARDAGARSERERALLEEGIARVGRLRTQLDAFDREQPAKTVTAPSDGGGR